MKRGVGIVKSSRGRKFEGLEECKQESKIGMDNVKRIWEEL
ncbi:hypothetical protein [Metabacillus arenae]|nr:hypothetical protein [Metabacillus arenae]